MKTLDCKIVGITKGRCMFTRRDNLEVYALEFEGKPLTVDVKKLRDYISFKSDELGINFRVEEDAAPELEVLSSDDLMSA